jgi:hypothetical protein
MTEAQRLDVDQEADGGDVQTTGHKFEIVVNGRKKVVDHRVLTFEEVVVLAGYSPSTDPNVTFTVTFSRAVGPRPEGILSEGGEVTIRHGTIFDVTRTDKS